LPLPATKTDSEGRTYTQRGQFWIRKEGVGIFAKYFLEDGTQIKNMNGMWAFKDPNGGWVMSKPQVMREQNDSVLETTSILQRFFGLPGLTPTEQNFIIDKYLFDEITDADWNILRNTLPEQKILDIKRHLDLLVRDKTQRLAEADRQLADTRAAQKFVDNLPLQGSRITLACGHRIMKHGATMEMFDRLLRNNPKLKTLKCQACGVPFDVKILTQ
jgi:hypothetical protein